MLLSGRIDGLFRSLKADMMRAARSLRFEEANAAKNAMDALVRIRSLPVSPVEEDRSEDRPLGQIRSLAEALRKYSIDVPIKRSNRIEGFDVSSLQGQAMTGSMVVFTGGVPDIKEYRHFRIRTLEKSDDPRALTEMLERRLQHPEWPAPDLILIDGGFPQLLALQKHFHVASRFPSGVSFVGLAKQTEAVVIPVSPGKFSHLALGRSHPGLLLLMHIRDEAHRFSRRYHHQLRNKSFSEYNVIR